MRAISAALMVSMREAVTAADGPNMEEKIDVIFLMLCDVMLCNVVQCNVTWTVGRDGMSMYVCYWLAGWLVGGGNSFNAVVWYLLSVAKELFMFVLFVFRLLLLASIDRVKL